MNDSMREAQTYIEQIPLFGPMTDGRNKSGNENLLQVMENLGNPHQKKACIHVAGTNGKGSTVTFLACMLREEGYRVRTFTSPHLVDMTERIEGISEEEFCETFELVKQACEKTMEQGGMHLSYFEFLFAMAAVYFAGTDADYIIYETGLGGRLDATNILQPKVSVITAIGLDHEKYLGTTIPEIAREKAGIIKAQTPVVFHTGNVEADRVVMEQARLMQSCAVNVANVEYIIDGITDKTIDFSIHSRYYDYSGLHLAGQAVYQIDNAVTALEVCRVLLGKTWKAEYLQCALDRFYWPGRMEELAEGLIVDGAHNLHAIHRFVQSVVEQYGDMPYNLLFAVATDKDYEPMIAKLMKDLSMQTVYVTALQNERGISADYIAALFRKYAKEYEKTVRVVAQDEMDDCVTQAYQASRQQGARLFAVGSLYLAGKLKDTWRNYD